jgi:glycosyltransferase involved in cell wall biosynthesis
VDGPTPDRLTPVAARTAALVPTHFEPPERAFLEELGRLVGRVVVVDDGSPPEAARALDALMRETGAELVRLPANAGKGFAVAAGLRHLAGRADAVLVLDADGQHPTSAVPAFLAAAERAELVVGDRFGDLSTMPVDRRLANRLASAVLSLRTRRRVRDSQCGMRLLRGRALADVLFPEGGYEAETLHLKRCLRAGVRVEWVPIPTVYAGEPSSFRSVRDTARVLRALLR